jgi:hypothetical protein
MSTPSWIIGLMLIFILMTVIGNVIEKANILTNIQMTQIRTASKMETVNTKDVDTGAAATYGNLNYGVLEAVVKALTSDFAWLYKIDKTKTAVTCVAAGGRWNSTSSVCMMPSQYYWIWILIYYPILVGVLFMLTLSILFRNN